jgi:hypothetical protein
MFKRFLTALTVGSAVAGLALAPVATAREVPPPVVSGEVSKPLPAPAQQLLQFGATGVLPQGPGRPTETSAPAATGGDTFDWNGAGNGAALLLGVAALGVGSLLTVRHKQGPILH